MTKRTTKTPTKYQKVRRNPGRPILRAAAESAIQLVARHRHTLPPPISPQEIYDGLLPAGYHDLYGATLPANQVTATMQNFRRLLTPDLSVSFVTKSSDGVTQVWRIRLSTPLPTPLSGKSLRLTKEHPQWDKLASWMVQAEAIEERIHKSVATLRDIKKFVDSCNLPLATGLALVPQLVPFVKGGRRCSIKPLGAHTAKTIRQFNAIVDATHLPELDEMLAAATLLPDKSGDELLCWLET